MGDPGELTATIEGARILHEPADGPWRQWGPYLSERQWGTVREDYSAESNPWAYFPFDHARSRAYRWGEDGLAGFCDRHQHWCLSLALWNGADPFLKERLFGLANGQGNHGEDVKELCYYQDGLPSHAYMRMLYKYPLDAFPYEQLVAENARRGMDEPEFEILDTGLFDAGRYADIAIEYAKAAPDDILMRVTVTSRSSALHLLHVLPQITARNIWSWDGATAKPVIAGRSDGGLDLTHPQMAAMRVESEGRPPLHFCENETNPLLFGQPRTGLFKDGICNFLVKGDRTAISTQRRGTKCALHHRLILQPHEPLVIRLRLRPADSPAGGFADFDDIFAERIAETDAFHAALSNGIADPHMRLVQRQALAGLLWSKQFYDYDIRDWMRGDPAQPAPPQARQKGRNADWPHLRNRDIISMPDCWEYPWYASWDLALQALPFAMMDPQFAKEQMQLLIRDWYMHPNAQLPAYEWNFSNANPPVQGWAAMHVYEADARLTGKKDRAFLERMFQRLMLNFTWWVNRKDLRGRNLFEGGFLGLDNIEIFDRSQPLPGGWFLSQSDGTAWMAMMALDLLRMALELAPDNHVYEDAAAKLFEHFLYITAAADRRGGLWDDEDGFFYDLLESPKGETTPLRGRSLVGLIPLCVVAVLDSDCFARFPRFAGRLDWLLENRPELAALVSHWKVPAIATACCFPCCGASA